MAEPLIHSFDHIEHAQDGRAQRLAPGLPTGAVIAGGATPWDMNFSRPGPRGSHLVMVDVAGVGPVTRAAAGAPGAR